MPFIVEDDILAPRGDITVGYRGYNPLEIYEKIRDFMLTIFHARGVDYFEDFFQWDVTVDPAMLYVRIHIDRKIDKFTRAYVYIVIHGKQSKASKQGWVNIKISGKITTVYPTETVLQKAMFWPFLYIYHYVMYNNIRRKYIGIYKKWIEELEREIRSTFNLIQRARLA